LAATIKRLRARVIIGGVLGDDDGDEDRRKHDDSADVDTARRDLQHRE
jgi:hypothetical protein